jgi:sulfonate transport system permease protein
VTALAQPRGGIRGLPRRREAGPLAVAVGALVLWELLAVTVFAGRHVLPTPTSVVSAMFADHFYLPHVATTLSESWRGWLIGNGIAVALAATCLLVPRIEGYLLSVGVISYCVPIVAIGPILLIVTSPFDAKVGMAALSVFFVTLVSAVTGLRQAPAPALDVVTGLGGGRWKALWKVRLRAAVPSLAAGLTISAPAAILGAIIGDYLGGQQGLGVALLQAQGALEVNRTWAIALVATALSGAAFALVALVARALTGSAAPTVDVGTIARERARRPWPLVAGLAIIRVAIGVAVVVAVWSLAIRFSGLSPFFAKSPSDVWHYLWAGPLAATGRSALLAGLRQSLHDALFGWVAGMLAAMVCAGLLTVSRAVATAVYPLILVLRSVPLVAMTPLIALTFGRGLVGVTVVAGIITFVPSVITLAEGLRRAPQAALDVVTCGGGSHWVGLLKVRAPFAAASAFAAAKISLPGALLGAILAEWLITGRGLGEMMAIVVVVVVLSVTLYTVVGACEQVAERRLAA